MARMRPLLAVLLAFGTFGALADEALGPIRLNIFGAGVAANRGPVEPHQDKLLAELGVAFDAAFVIDRAGLAALGKEEAAIGYFPEIAPFTARGPVLADVLAAAGAPDGTALTVTGIDGYSVTLSPQELAGGAFMLAIEADGGPLPIGGRGPVWLLSTHADPPAELRKKMVWGILAIAVAAPD